VACCLTVLFAGVEIGIGVGIGVSLLLVIYKIAFPRISQLGRLVSLGASKRPVACPSLGTGTLCAAADLA